MEKLYNAGNLFNEAEVRQRQWEGELLNAQLPNIFVYNPIDAPVNDKSKLPTAEDIFSLDTYHIRGCDYMIADLTNNDVGTAMELGIATEINAIFDFLEKQNYQEVIKALNRAGWHYKKAICGVASDIRTTTSGEYNDYRVPYGLNQYVVGGILKDKNGSICKKFEEAAAIVREKSDMGRE